MLYFETELFFYGIQYVVELNMLNIEVSRAFLIEVTKLDRLQVSQVAAV